MALQGTIIALEALKQCGRSRVKLLVAKLKDDYNATGTKGRLVVSGTAVNFPSGRQTF